MGFFGVAFFNVNCGYMYIIYIYIYIYRRYMCLLDLMCAYVCICVYLHGFVLVHVMVSPIKVSS